MQSQQWRPDSRSFSHGLSELAAIRDVGQSELAAGGGKGILIAASSPLFLPTTGAAHVGGVLGRDEGRYQISHVGGQRPHLQVLPHDLV